MRQLTIYLGGKRTPKKNLAANETMGDSGPLFRVLQSELGVRSRVGCCDFLLSPKRPCERGAVGFGPKPHAPQFKLDSPQRISQYAHSVRELVCISGYLTTCSS